MREKRIPVFGPYFNGNFGDDLMGHLIAKQLLKSGYNPILWRGPQAQIEGMKWHTCSNIEEFVGDSRCVVYGGGLPFCNARIPFWDDLNAFIDVCEQRDVSVVAISIGSQGTHSNLHKVAKRFATTKILKAASLRLKVDEQWLGQLVKEVEYIPDIVLTALPYVKRNTVRKVLFSMAVHPIEYPLLNRIVRKLIKNGFEIRTISQFMDNSIQSRSFYHFPYAKLINNGPDDMISAIKKADVVVTTGLHPGITALSSGADLISYRGQGKALTFLNQIERQNNAIITKNKIEKLFSANKLYSLLMNFKTSDDQMLMKIRKESENHYRFLIQKIERFS